MELILSYLCKSNFFPEFELVIRWRYNKNTEYIIPTILSLWYCFLFNAFDQSYVQSNYLFLYLNQYFLFNGFDITWVHADYDYLEYLFLIHKTIIVNHLNDNNFNSSLLEKILKIGIHLDTITLGLCLNGEIQKTLRFLYSNFISHILVSKYEKSIEGVYFSLISI
jgi:hypothetical protein